MLNMTPTPFSRSLRLFMATTLAVANLSIVSPVFSQPSQSSSDAIQPDQVQQAEVQQTMSQSADNLIPPHSVTSQFQQYFPGEVMTYVEMAPGSEIQSKLNQNFLLAMSLVSEFGARRAAMCPNAKPLRNSKPGDIKPNGFAAPIQAMPHRQAISGGNTAQLKHLSYSPSCSSSMTAEKWADMKRRMDVAEKFLANQEKALMPEWAMASWLDATAVKRLLAPEGVKKPLKNTHRKSSRSAAKAKTSKANSQLTAANWKNPYTANPYTSMPSHFIGAAVLKPGLLTSSQAERQELQPLLNAFNFPLAEFKHISSRLPNGKTANYWEHNPSHVVLAVDQGLVLMADSAAVLNDALNRAHGGNKPTPLTRNPRYQSLIAKLPSDRQGLIVQDYTVIYRVMDHIMQNLQNNLKQATQRPGYPSAYGFNSFQFIDRIQSFSRLAPVSVAAVTVDTAQNTLSMSFLTPLRFEVIKDPVFQQSVREIYVSPTPLRGADVVPENGGLLWVAGNGGDRWMRVMIEQLFGEQHLVIEQTATSMLSPMGLQLEDIYQLFAGESDMALVLDPAYLATLSPNKIPEKPKSMPFYPYLFGDQASQKQPTLDKLILFAGKILGSRSGPIERRSGKEGRILVQTYLYPNRPGQALSLGTLPNDWVAMSSAKGLSFLPGGSQASSRVMSQSADFKVISAGWPKAQNMAMYVTLRPFLEKVLPSFQATMTPSQQEKLNSLPAAFGFSCEYLTDQQALHTQSRLLFAH
ncbi:MAG: hypothetical protein K2X01_11855 [Cyanobacteria bacterium]|nr:hypothetical protein [Cyanobacteriota bacterium]